MRAACATLVLLGACASSQPQELPAPPLPQRAGVDPTVAARAHSVAYRGEGEGFVLHIFRADRIMFSWNGGANEEGFPKPEPRYPRWNGVIYETSNATHRLFISIRNDRPCPDAPGLNVVEVRLDAQEEFTGCGREF